MRDIVLFQDDFKDFAIGEFPYDKDHSAAGEYHYVTEENGRIRYVIIHTTDMALLGSLPRKTADITWSPAVLKKTNLIACFLRCRRETYNGKIMMSVFACGGCPRKEWLDWPFA